jgi:hypothetical protein
MTELDRPTRAKLLAALDNIATWLAEELDTTIAKLTAQPEMVGSPSSETPLPINADALDAAMELNGTLDDWINEVCRTHRHITYPGRLRIQPSAAWLYNHYIDLFRHENVTAAARDIIEAYNRAYQIVEQKREPAWKQADPIAAAATELNPSGLETLGRELGGDYVTLTQERVESLRRNGHITPVRAIEGIGNLYDTGDVLIAHLTVPMRKRKRAA